MTFHTLAITFMGAYTATTDPPTALEQRLARRYARLATGTAVSDLDQWLDQLSLYQLWHLYHDEACASDPGASVLKLVCFQFLTLTIGGQIPREQLEHCYWAARQRIAERLRETL